MYGGTQYVKLVTVYGGSGFVAIAPLDWLRMVGVWVAVRNQ
jgi:hypothetical protein